MLISLLHFLYIHINVDSPSRERIRSVICHHVALSLASVAFPMWRYRPIGKPTFSASGLTPLGGGATLCHVCGRLSAYTIIGSISGLGVHTWQGHTHLTLPVSCAVDVALS